MTVRKFFCRILPALLLLTGVLLPARQTPAADDSLTRVHAETGYTACIVDDADLLSEEEEQVLMDKMSAVTPYGNAALITIDENPKYNARAYAESAYYDMFGNDSGVLLLIDMDTRMLWLSTSGAVYKVVNSAYCTSITDNVYTYASRRDYAGCAGKVFDQVNTLLSGQKISQPMKHISNLLLAGIISILINFTLVVLISQKGKPSNKSVMSAATGSRTISGLSVRKTGTTKRYSPRSDSSSGGGGGRSSGGGGGGFSGGGGGHSF